MVAPFLKVSSLKELFDQTQETVIVDFLGQSLQKEFVIQLVGTGFDVTAG